MKNCINDIFHLLYQRWESVATHISSVATRGVRWRSFGCLALLLMLPPSLKRFWQLPAQGRQPSVSTICCWVVPQHQLSTWAFPCAWEEISLCCCTSPTIPAGRCAHIASAPCKSPSLVGGHLWGVHLGNPDLLDTDQNQPNTLLMICVICIPAMRDYRGRSRSQHQSTGVGMRCSGHQELVLPGALHGISCQQSHHHCWMQLALQEKQLCGGVAGNFSSWLDLKHHQQTKTKHQSWTLYCTMLHSC